MIKSSIDRYCNLEVHVRTFLSVELPPVTVFTAWPPISSQIEIWDRSGIDLTQVSSFLQHQGPATSVFGRIKDKPSGTAFVGISQDKAQLEALHIAAGFRRHGLGGHMVRGAAQWAEHQGADWICARVHSENAGALTFFQSLGFESKSDADQTLR